MNRVKEYAALFLMLSSIFGITSEIHFQINYAGNPGGNITFSADAIGNVYWKDGSIANQYSHKEFTVNIPVNGAVIPGFDIFDQNTGIPNNDDRTLGMGLYRITSDRAPNSCFYWDTRDCNLFDSIPAEMVLPSPDVKITMDLSDGFESFDSFDYGSGVNGLLITGDTLLVGWCNPENYVPNYHPYYCWNETRIVLTNKYIENNAGGVFSTDYSEDEILSGAFTYVPIEVERIVTTEDSLSYENSSVR